MGDPAGKRPQCLQALRAQELPLEGLVLRDVCCNRNVAVAVSFVVVSRGGGNEQVDRPAVAPCSAQFVVYKRFTAQGAFVEKIGLLALVFADERHLLAENLLGCPAKDARCSLVPKPDVSVPVHGDDCLRSEEHTSELQSRRDLV